MKLLDMTTGFFWFAFLGASFAFDIDSRLNNVLGAADNVLYQVSSCTNVNIDLDSCLMTTFIPFFVENSGSFDMKSDDLITSSINQCKPPKMNDEDIAMMLNQAKDICTFNQEMLDDFAVVLQSVMDIILDEACWESVCETTEKEVNNVLDSFDFERLIIDGIGNCTGVSVDPESCIVSTTIETILFTAIGGAEGDKARRMLTQTEDDDVCFIPDIDEDIITPALEDAQSKCTEGGEYTDNESIDDIKLAVSTLFGEESCWVSLCKEVTNLDTFVNGEAANEIKEVLIDEVAVCTGVDLDADSCIVSSSLDAILFSAITGDEGDHARRMLSSEENESVCAPPDIDVSIVSQIVLGAQISCQENGEDATDKTVEDVIMAISKVFSGEESCWMSLCKQVENQVMEIVNETKGLKEMSLEYVLGCASINIDAGSCIQKTFLDMILSEEDATKYNTDRKLQHRQFLKRRATYDEFGNNMESDLPQCPLPRFDPVEVDLLLSDISKQCTENSSEDDLDQSRNVLSALFNAEQCWESICSDDALVTIASNQMETCLDIELPKSMTEPSLVENSPILYADDRTLGCMLEYVMSLDPLDIGLHPLEESESCFPNGLKEMASVCPEIAPEALKHCGAFSRPPKEPHLMSFSYSYGYGDDEYSYGYNDNWYGHGNDESVDDDEASMGLVETFCSILEEISGDMGRECLKPLCGLFELDNFSWGGNRITTTSPSTEEVFNAPSVHPSIPPTIAPSIVPMDDDTSSTSAVRVTYFLCALAAGAALFLIEV